MPHLMIQAETGIAREPLLILINIINSESIIAKLIITSDFYE